MRTNLSQLNWTFSRQTERIVVAYRYLNIQTPQHPQFGGIQATQQLGCRHTLQRLPKSKEGLWYEEEILCIECFCCFLVDLSADAEECGIIFAFLEGQVRGLIGDDYIFIDHIAYLAWAGEEGGGSGNGGVHYLSGFGWNSWTGLCGSCFVYQRLEKRELQVEVRDGEEAEIRDSELEAISRL